MGNGGSTAAAHPPNSNHPFPPLLHLLLGVLFALVSLFATTFQSVFQLRFPFIFALTIDSLRTKYLFFSPPSGRRNPHLLLWFLRRNSPTLSITNYYNRRLPLFLPSVFSPSILTSPGSFSVSSYFPPIPPTILSSYRPDFLLFSRHQSSQILSLPSDPACGWFCSAHQTSPYPITNALSLYLSLPFRLFYPSFSTLIYIFYFSGRPNVVKTTLDLVSLYAGRQQHPWKRQISCLPW